MNIWHVHQTCATVDFPVTEQYVQDIQAEEHFELHVKPQPALILIRI